MLHSFYQKITLNIVKNIIWSELNHPSLSKRSTECTTQDLGREHSILLSVTHINQSINNFFRVALVAMPLLGHYGCYS